MTKNLKDTSIVGIILIHSTVECICYKTIWTSWLLFLSGLEYLMGKNIYGKQSPSLSCKWLQHVKTGEGEEYSKGDYKRISWSKEKKKDMLESWKAWERIFNNVDVADLLGYWVS